MDTMTIESIEGNLDHAVDLGLIRSWARQGAEHIGIVAYGPDDTIRLVECTTLAETSAVVAALLSATHSPTRILVSRGAVRSAVAPILAYGDPSERAPQRSERTAAIRVLATMVAGEYGTDTYDDVFTFIDSETRRIVREHGWDAQYASDLVADIDRLADALISRSHA